MLLLQELIEVWGRGASSNCKNQRRTQVQRFYHSWTLVNKLELSNSNLKDELIPDSGFIQEKDVYLGRLQIF
ncbi:MAG: hypothetical protein R2766_09610 [Saprospiraceae bacterium]